MKKILLFLLIGLSLNVFAQHPCAAPGVTMLPSTASCLGNSAEELQAVTHAPNVTYLWSPGGKTTDTIWVFPSCTTTYSCTVTDSCGNTTKTVTVDNPCMAVCCNYTLASGHDTLLVASGIRSIVSYTWSPSVTCLNPPLCDSVIVSPTVTTTYTVTGTDSIGCQVERFVTITVGPASIPFISGTNFVNVYPNPSATEFTVGLPIKAQISVCDITGCILFSQKENAGTITFGRELNPGMYFLFIDGKPGVRLVKL